MAKNEKTNSPKNAETITSVVKEDRRIEGYELSSGEVVEKEEGVELAKQGEIDGVDISQRNGNEYLRTQRDGTDNNNLGNLPSTENRK